MRRIETIERDRGARQSPRNTLTGAKKRIQRHACTFTDKRKDEDKENSTPIRSLVLRYAQKLTVHLLNSP